MAIRETSDGGPLFLPRNIDLDDGHGVVAEDVHDFDGECSASGRTFVEDAGEFERAVFLGAERLPFVFENVIACPDFFVFWEVELFGLFHAGHLDLFGRATWDADDFALALKVEIDGPIVDPVGPFFREALAGDHAFGVLGDFNDLTFFGDNLAGFFLDRGFGGGDGVLGVEDGEISQLDGDGTLFNVRLDFDRGDIMEDDLILFDGALVKDFGGDVFGRDVNPLGAGFVQDVGKEAHFEFEAEDVHAGDVFLAALEDDFFDEEAGHGKVDGTDGDEAASFLADKSIEAVGPFRAIGPEDQVYKCGLLLLELLPLFRLPQIGVDADIMLTLIPTKVKDFERAIILPFSLQFSLSTNDSLSRRVDRELT